MRVNKASPGLGLPLGVSSGCSAQVLGLYACSAILARPGLRRGETAAASSGGRLTNTITTQEFLGLGRCFNEFRGAPNLAPRRSAPFVCTAWDSEIESLTSLNPILIELDRRKTRRRHRVTAALAPRKSCFLPCNANLHASSASLKHGLPPPSLFEWSSFLAHRLVVITHAVVKLRCKKDTAENWQKSTLLEKTQHLLHRWRLARCPHLGVLVALALGYAQTTIKLDGHATMRLCYLATSITWLSFTAKILVWRTGSGGGWPRPWSQAKSHDQGFSFEKIRNSVQHSNSKCWHDRNFPPFTAVFDILSVDRFASDYLISLEFEASGDKSAPEKLTFERARLRERREREREREREERDGG